MKSIHSKAPEIGSIGKFIYRYNFTSQNNKSLQAADNVFDLQRPRTWPAGREFATLAVLQFGSETWRSIKVELEVKWRVDLGLNWQKERK